MKISFLCSSESHPVNAYLERWRLSQEHEITVTRKKAQLPGGDILFLLSCNEIVGPSDRAAYRATLVLHASPLPQGRGWSPHIWQVVQGAEQICVTLLEAADPVDTGAIWRQTFFQIPKHALWDEINDRLFQAEFELVDFAIREMDRVTPQPQDTARHATYFERRTPAHSRIDPMLSIASQFDLIRVCDPLRFPAFFELHGCRYKLTVEKLDREPDQD